MLDTVGDSVAVRVTCREIRFRGSFDRGQEEGAGCQRSRTTCESTYLKDFSMRTYMLRRDFSNTRS